MGERILAPGAAAARKALPLALVRSLLRKWKAQLQPRYFHMHAYTLAVFGVVSDTVDRLLLSVCVRRLSPSLFTPIFLFLSLHGSTRRVLHLEPIGRAARLARANIFAHCLALTS
jgi:hypothetical protein